VRSVVTYGAEIWGLRHLEEIDNLQNFFVKKLLKLPKNTSNLLLCCYKDMWEEQTDLQNFNWSSLLYFRIKDFLPKGLWNCKSPDEIRAAIPKIVSKYQQSLVVQDVAKMMASTHFPLYKRIKTHDYAEEYTKTPTPLRIAGILARIRMGSIFIHFNEITLRRDKCIFCSQFSSTWSHLFLECHLLSNYRPASLSNINPSHHPFIETFWESLIKNTNKDFATLIYRFLEEISKRM
ncbi:unnamed protein product, partial [Allacma fusca]